MAGLTGARGAGLLARRVEDAADLGNAMREVLAHDGPALIDVVCARQELAMPPRIEAEQVKGFSLWAIKAVIDGRGAQIIDLALTNLFR
ncbi:MAG: putative isoamylase protein [Bradyrhizobium sp.]|nr:putative isoamylase protein [Bradyrhizobium sp.]